MTKRRDGEGKKQGVTPCKKVLQEVTEKRRERRAAMGDRRFFSAER